MPRWIVMWTTAFLLYAACKALTLVQAPRRSLTASWTRTVGYLVFWPGMDAEAFLARTDRPAIPAPSDWLSAAGRTAAGILLFWLAARGAFAIHPLLAGWIGMTGVILTLHFGTFDLISLAWRRAGVNAIPVMRHPLRSTSLGEFWGRRWNTAFHELANRFSFKPLRSHVGVPAAALLVFLISGAIHELVISVPAGGGYGLPTAYFGLQGLAVLGERSTVAQAFGLGHGWRGRTFAVVVAAGPAFWLFPPVFIRRVILPMLASVGTN